MVAYSKDLLAQFEEYMIKLVPREQNSNADALEKLASVKDANTLNIVPVEYLTNPSITEQETMPITVTDTWMTPIITYLEQGTLPDNCNDAKRMMRQAARYVMMEGVYYKRGYSMLLLRHGITKSFSSVVHPQVNGQVEAVNKTLKDTLKKRLEQAKGCWAEELPEVLWSYRTTARIATGHAPFSLAYGYEAMIPVEINPLSHRRSTYNQDENNQLLTESLDFIEEKREKASIRVAAHQQKVARYFNSRVKDRKFQV
ncbi:uncharacterized protein LOC133832579 [Humulus lupulus]|uniref:uncharacterized protein LOC133832579 n=1 Tax=Humulus lupulus TaxID=3486 RepID=UPI002B408F74|nr:uncharacterized protein LOC133832579 [Humulus lupulus]